MSALRTQVEQFLYREAWLADSHAYSGWLALWAEDGCYWMPCNDDDQDPDKHVALMYDQRRGLEDRVTRLNGEFAHSQQPRSRLSRIVGNIIVTEQVGEMIEARSTFNLTAFRREIMETFAGRTIHMLRRSGDTFLIARKTVYLVNNDGYIGNMTFLV
jgi:3-phenylpropionate/cinnamic acid dioxygenase small subunit